MNLSVFIRLWLVSQSVKNGRAELYATKVVDKYLETIETDWRYMYVFLFQWIPNTILSTKLFFIKKEEESFLSDIFLQRKAFFEKVLRLLQGNY